MACPTCRRSSSGRRYNTAGAIVSDSTPHSCRVFRVSLLFRDAPTDADYAMELIAKRIATGQDVGRASFRNPSRHTFNASASTDSLTPTLYGTSHEVQSEGGGINWKKWGERFARGKAFLEEGSHFLSTPVCNLQTLASKLAQPYPRAHRTRSRGKPLLSAVQEARVHTVCCFLRAFSLTLDVLD